MSQYITSQTIGLLSAFSVVNAGGASGGGIVNGTGVQPQSALPPAMDYSSLSTSALTKMYVLGFIETPAVPPCPREFMRYDHNFVRIGKFLDSHEPLFRAMEERAADGVQFVEALKVASTMPHAFDAGLCLGVLNPDVEFETRNKEFKKGLITGQARAIKDGASFVERRLFKAGIAGAVVSGVALTSALGPEEFDRSLLLPFELAGIASWIYGAAVMRRTKLFGNDACPSEKLITTGAFAMHRNPYYASMATVLLSGISGALYAHTASGGSNLAMMGTAIVSSAVVLTGWYKKTKRDEVVLEKQFGNEYREYKERTPRYLPAFWKLFSKK